MNEATGKTLSLRQLFLIFIICVFGLLAVFGSEYVQSKLGIGNTNPLVALDVAGSIKVGNGGEQCQSVSAGVLRFNAVSSTIEYCNGTSWSGLVTASSTGQWSVSGSNFYRSGGNVGIGTSNPAFLLDVNGEIRLRDAGPITNNFQKTPSSCTPVNEGALHYSASVRNAYGTVLQLGMMYFCDGSSWEPMYYYPPGGGAGP